MALALLVSCANSEGTLQATILGPANAAPAPGASFVLQGQVTFGGIPMDPGRYAYQWLKDGREIPGAVSSSLSLSPVALTDAGSYRLRVTAGSAGTLFSQDYELEPGDESWVVTSGADDGPGTLRQVLAAAGSAAGVNAIRFELPPADLWTIQLRSALPPISGNLRILGPASPPLEVDGGGRCRPFFQNGGSLTLDGFTVTGGLGKGGDAPGGGGGAAGMGGALFINSGAVTLRHMTFRGNTAQGGTSRPGSDAENGGGAGFGGDSPAAGGNGADGGFLGGKGGEGHLDGTATTDDGGGPATGGDGAGGGAARGGLLTDPVAGWADNLPGGDATFGGGGGFSLGPLGGGGGGSTFGGGGGASGGRAQGVFFPGIAAGAGGIFGGDGALGADGIGGSGGGGGGMGGAVFLRDGALSLIQCTFLDNAARPGGGGEAGLGKGGALFIYPFDESAPFDLAMLQAQTYAGNLATDVVEDRSFDNDDYYVAQTLLAIKPGSPLDLLYRRYKQDRKLGRVPGWLSPFNVPDPAP
jgi:hypothetical protein